MFTMQNGLLTTSNTNIDPRYLVQAADTLTEAERQIENAKVKAIEAREDFLKRLSEKTGIPLAKKDLRFPSPAHRRAIRIGSS